MVRRRLGIARSAVIRNECAAHDGCLNSSCSSEARHGKTSECVNAGAEGGNSLGAAKLRCHQVGRVISGSAQKTEWKREECADAKRGAYGSPERDRVRMISVCQAFQRPTRNKQVLKSPSQTPSLTAHATIPTRSLVTSAGQRLTRHGLPRHARHRSGKNQLGATKLP